MFVAYLSRFFKHAISGSFDLFCFKLYFTDTGGAVTPHFAPIGRPCAPIPACQPLPDIVCWAEASKLCKQMRLHALAAECATHVLQMFCQLDRAPPSEWAHRLDYLYLDAQALKHAPPMLLRSLSQVTCFFSPIVMLVCIIFVFCFHFPSLQCLLIYADSLRPLPPPAATSSHTHGLLHTHFFLLRYILFLLVDV